jgi:DNA-binding IclR family transcriptional regulator
MLRTLEAREFVVADRRTGRYSIAGSVVELARAAGDDALVGYAHATLQRLSLRTGGTRELRWCSPRMCGRSPSA